VGWSRHNYFSDGNICALSLKDLEWDADSTTLKSKICISFARKLSSTADADIY
jgi:hypothetical protein